MNEPGEFQPQSNGHGEELPVLADLVELPVSKRNYCFDTACQGLSKLAELLGEVTPVRPMGDSGDGLEIIKRGVDGLKSVDVVKTGDNVGEIRFRGMAKRRTVKNSVRQFPKRRNVR